MPILVRFIGNRLAAAALRRPRKDGLAGIGLAHFSTGLPPPNQATGNPKPKPSRTGLYVGIGSAILAGGLGYAYMIYTEEEQAACAPAADPPSPLPFQFQPLEKDDVRSTATTTKTANRPKLVPPKSNEEEEQQLNSKEKEHPSSSTSKFGGDEDKKDEGYFTSAPKQQLSRKMDKEEEINAIQDCEKVLEELKFKLMELEMQYKEDLVYALSIQQRVHQDNLEHHRELMRADYERRLKQHEDLLEAEQLVEIRYKYKQATAALAAIRTVLSERKEQEELAQGSRKLWATCSTLYNRINFASPADASATSVINTNKDKLLEEFANDEFAIQLLKTIPEKLGSIEQLRERFFNKVDRTCRNVAIFRVDENEISLGKYILGYIQGSLIARCDGDKEDVKSVYEILDRTAFHLRRGELVDAVITLNKTEGLSRKVCQDWLSDAKAALEASQTLVALMTHANAVNQR